MINRISTGRTLAHHSLTKRISKVLVVEDEPIWQLKLHRALHKIDGRIEVVFSDNANQAIEEINREKIDFIIADHSLDGAKTGLDLWDHLMRQNLEIPYLILSGIRRSDFYDRIMPYRREMVPKFIEKPESIKELTDQLVKIVFTHFSCGSKDQLDS